MNKYIVIIAVIALVIYFIWKKKKKKVEEKSVNQMVSEEQDKSFPGMQSLEEQIISVLKEIADEYGIDTARNVEKVYRLETNHFKSGQFKRTFSPGMEKHKDTFPFGWKSMADYWKSIDFSPDFHSMPENKTGLMKTFIKFPNIRIPMKGLAMYIKKYGPERWYSMNPISQAKYRNALNSIKPKLSDKIFSNA